MVCFVFWYWHDGREEWKRSVRTAATKNGRACQMGGRCRVAANICCMVGSFMAWPRFSTWGGELVGGYGGGWMKGMGYSFSWR